MALGRWLAAAQDDILDQVQKIQIGDTRGWELQARNGADPNLFLTVMLIPEQNTIVETVSDNQLRPSDQSLYPVVTRYGAKTSDAVASVSS